MRELPLPRTPDQAFLAGVCERLDELNRLLADIRDRLAAPSPPPAGGAEEVLTEPAPATASGGAELAEPARPGKRPKTRRPAAKKTAQTRAVKKET